MDPVSHLLLARMVAAVRSSRDLPRGVVAATVLGGLAPDIDAALMAVGWDVYLRWHELGTHAIAGTPLVAILTAVVVRTWAPATSLPALAWAAWLGVLSHVFFDIYSGATIRLLWPISSHVFSMPVVAMADPLAIGVLLVGALALWVWPRVPRTAAAARDGAACRREWRQAHDPRVGLPPHTSRAASTQATARRRDRRKRCGDRGRAWLFFDRLPDGRIRAWRADGWTGDAQLRFEQAADPRRTVRATLARRVRDSAQLPAGASLRVCHVARQRQRRRGLLVRCALLLDGRRARRRAGRRAAPGRAPGARPGAMRAVVRRLPRCAGPPDRSARVAGRSPAATIAGSVGDRGKDGGRRREDGGRKED